MKEIHSLIKDTSIAFNKSDIKKFAETHNRKWFYSVSSTRVSPDNTIIVGFNWGAEDNTDYKPQLQIPVENFKELYDKKWLGSFQRVYKPLKKYFPNEDIDNCVQTNFCFFRSKKESQISEWDFKLSIPLFQMFIDLVKPMRIIGYSGTFRDYFLKNNLCTSVETQKIPSNGKTLFVAKGIYFANNRRVPVFFLPHPGSHYKAFAREVAWEFCFGK